MRWKDFFCYFTIGNFMWNVRKEREELGRDEPEKKEKNAVRWLAINAKSSPSTALYILCLPWVAGDKYSEPKLFPAPSEP